MAKVIIGIHGLANKSSYRNLRKWWKQSILEGIGNVATDIPFDLVYWSNYLYKHPLHAVHRFDFDSLFNDEPYIPAEPGARKRYHDSRFDKVRARFQALVGFTIEHLGEVVNLEKTGDALLARKLKDLHFYNDPDRRLLDFDGKEKPAKEVLQGALIQFLEKHRNKEIMLVAHSMGTIISYDVLRNLGRDPCWSDFEVPYFLTMGSPLGLNQVKTKIESERSYEKKRRKRTRTPSIVSHRWINVSDRIDPGAVDSHLRDDYSENARGIRVEDDLVANDYVGLDGKHNFHKSYGYLRTPEVADVIKEFLNR